MVAVDPCNANRSAAAAIRAPRQPVAVTDPHHVDAHDLEACRAKRPDGPSLVGALKQVNNILPVIRQVEVIARGDGRSPASVPVFQARANLRDAALRNEGADPLVELPPQSVDEAIVVVTIRSAQLEGLPVHTDLQRLPCIPEWLAPGPVLNLDTI